ncbi:MAG: glutathione S-transferase family protein, partial [Rudaea sp.]
PMKLYLGNKNYSSWSLRGWLAVKLSGEAFAEIVVPLAGVVPNPANFVFSPSGLVPCLHDDGMIVWDSLAIADHLAERHPEMWPADRVARAFARSITAEMHSGFAALRSDMSMCVRERVDVRPWSPRLGADIARICAIWDEARRRFGQEGAFLCGRYCLADVFFGPVAFRFQTYDVHPEGAAGAYLASLLGHPHMQEWERAARAETMVIEADEPRVLYRDKLAATSRA